MIRFTFAIGSFFLAFELFDAKAHQVWGPQQYAEVGIIALLIISIAAITIIHGDDD